MGDPGSAAAVQLKMGVEVALQLAGNPRFFQITSRAPGGQVGTTVRVAKAQKSKAQGSLRVVVLKRRPLTISIRPVQVRDAQGKPALHCKKNFDTEILLRRTNAVYTPQTNIVFKLGSTAPAPMDNEAEIAKALGDSSPKAMLPQTVEFDTFSKMFKKLREQENPKADFTIFLVERITHGGDDRVVFGVSDTQGKFSLVSDSGRDEDMKTMEHEIGHLFGESDDNSSEDVLMSQGTDGTKVPFADVIKIFNKNFS
jgi:hypothetical protein